MIGNWEFQGIYKLEKISPIFTFLHKVADKYPLECAIGEIAVGNKEFQSVSMAKVKELDAAISQGDNWMCRWTSEVETEKGWQTVENRLSMWGDVPKDVAHLSTSLAQGAYFELGQPFPVSDALVGTNWITEKRMEQEGKKSKEVEMATNAQFYYNGNRLSFDLHNTGSVCKELRGLQTAKEIYAELKNEKVVSPKVVEELLPALEALVVERKELAQKREIRRYYY